MTLRCIVCAIASSSGERTQGRRPRVKHLRFAAAALATTATGALLLAAPAFATEFHAFSTSFGEPGSGNGQLSLHSQLYSIGSGQYRIGSGLAVNEATHDVYVSDSGNSRVEEFSSSGSFVRAFAALEPTSIAIDNSGGPSEGDVYVVEPVLSTVSKFEADGTPVTSWGTNGKLTGFGAIKGIAVSDGGELFVAESGTMHWFNQDGTVHSSNFTIPRETAPKGLAVDTEGSFFKVDGSPEVTKFTNTGEKLGDPDGREDGAGVAVDSSSNDLYVLQSGEEGEGRKERGAPGFIAHFAHNCGSLTEHCTPVDSFGHGYLPAGETEGKERIVISNSTGIAVDAATHRIYVGDAASQHILVFGPVPGVALTLTKTGSGAGTVVSHTTPGIECGSTCSAEFGETSIVTLTATPSERSTFTGWGAGECKSEPAPDKCEVQMSGAKSVHAEFTAIPQEKLTVAKTGSGEGFVFGTSPGKEFTAISCGSTCEAEYNQAATILLTAQPEIGSRLKAWSGCKAEPSPTECEVEMSAAKAVEPDFVPAAGHVFADDITGSGVTALSEPTEVAIDQTTHDLYVNDPGNYRVEKFTPSGSFLFMIGREVNRTAVETSGREAETNVCPAPGHPADVCQSGTPGTGPGAFEDPALLAVDNSGGESNGDLYVGDPSDDLIQKFGPDGRIVSTWGVSGQKNGSDIYEEPPHHFVDIRGMDVNSAGELYVQAGFQGYVWIYGQEGHPKRKASSASEPAGHLGFRVNPSGFRAPDSFFQFEEEKNQFGGNHTYAIIENADSGDPERSFKTGIVTSVASTTGFAFDPADGTLYQDVKSVKEASHGPGVESYSPSCEPRTGPCAPSESFGNGHLFGNAGVGVDGSNSTVYVANTETNDVAVFEDARPRATTGPPSALGLTSATLTGTVDPESHGKNHGPITECTLEYGFTNSYGSFAPCEQPTPYTGEQQVTAKLENLTPISELPVGTAYHYRFVAVNEVGAIARGQDRVFKTASPPRIEGLLSSHVTATSADLEASIDPHGLATSYTFQYGTTTAYGHTVSGEITGSLGELGELHSVKAHIEGLQRGATYHFRLLAENEADQNHPVTSEDQTFEFFPPSCPNSAVRQQTGAVYLPDCRAYELVSPGSANGTLYYPGGPSTGQATSPSRFAYTGAFSAPPGVNPINMAGDLYVSTRTPTGWVSHYIGLPGDQAGCMGGVPTDGRNVQAGEDPRRITNGVLTNSSMSLFLNYLDGSGLICHSGRYIFEDEDRGVAAPSMAPYLWNPDGGLEGRFPSAAGANPAALQALQCPYSEENAANMGTCSGETTASGDLSHLVFSSNSFSFSEPGEPAGLTAAPGSAYVDDLATGHTALISRLPASLGGGPIPQDPGFANIPRKGSGDAAYQGGAEEFIRFPAVSEDGSHILMSTATEAVPIQCGAFSQSYACTRYVEYPLHLYMRVQHGASGETYEIAENPATHEPAEVNFVGMTPDGSKVYFTSEEHLTHEDEAHGGASLYLWSAEKAENGEDPLTLVSKGPSEVPGSPGDTANCHPPLAPLRGNPFVEREGRVFEGSYKGSVEAQPWTTSCGVVPYSGYRYSWLQGGLGGSGFEGRTGGTGFTPAGIAANGDIYFYSPERLEGVHGTPNQENLFLYRNGRLQYVTTLEPERKCGPHPQGDEDHCSDGPIVRMQITPDDSHMAFITASQVTPYNNNGHLEMYTYTPESGEIHCASCNPDGQPPTADVFGSEDGLFLTNDGRVFFSTTESLVPRDTNEGEDVYEYVDGRPQLITPGTGTAVLGSTGITGSEGHTEVDPGLVGVSANGTDVYFSTLDTLLPEDHNGSYLKFYDARANGGFPQPTPAQPCAAAEECHGPGSEAPQLPAQGTAASLAGGNATPGSYSKHHKKKHHRKATKKRRHRRANAQRGGSK